MYLFAENTIYILLSYRKLFLNFKMAAKKDEQILIKAKKSPYYISLIKEKDRK